MAELWKNRYNHQLISDLAHMIKVEYPEFKTNEFINDTIDKTWEELELKARIRKITLNLGKYLLDDYKRAITILDKVNEQYPVGYNDFTLMYFPDFVEVFGQHESHWNISIRALERFTKTSTSEFAVRQFIINDEKRMMQQIFKWTTHENEHVRRLASEGCRPQLPWGQTLQRFKIDPSPILPILEQLKDDPSLYVRKSVANNLNDISKTHPDLVIQITKNWYGKSSRTDWILKHGCRTLLRNGNQEVLELFGFKDTDCINIKNFTLDKNLIYMGEEISFSFIVETKKDIKLRLEYAIDLVRSNGKQNRKTFQISEISLAANSQKTYTKKHSFATISSRKYYPGLHSITLIVNGKQWDKIDFELLSLEKDNN